jgi:hypothetical protein
MNLDINTPRGQKSVQEEQERAEKAEAEVERLKEQLESTQNLCLKFWGVLEELGFELEINQ